MQLNPLTGATDDKLQKILECAKTKEIPVVFSCTRKELGFAVYGRFARVQAKVAVLSVLNVSGVEDVCLKAVFGIVGSNQNCERLLQIGISRKNDNQII